MDLFRTKKFRPSPKRGRASTTPGSNKFSIDGPPGPGLEVSQRLTIALRTSQALKDRLLSLSTDDHDDLNRATATISNSPSPQRNRTVLLVSNEGTRKSSDSHNPRSFGNEHLHVAHEWSAYHDHRLKYMSTAEELTYHAMHSDQESLQAIGFKKAMEAFPNANEARLANKTTMHIEDDLERFEKLYPSSRYGLTRTEATFEDERNWFRDLNPDIDIQMRREGKALLPDKGHDARDEEILSKEIKKRQKHLHVSPLKPEPPTFLEKPQIPPEFDEADLLQDGDQAFPSKIEIFSQRLNALHSSQDPSMGKLAYLAACSDASIVPNSYFLDNLTRSHVDMQHMGISPLSVVAMSSALRDNKFITHLDLSDNMFGDSAGESLITALLGSKTITSLVIPGNAIGRRTGPLIADLLLSPTTKLSNLDVSRNRLGDRPVIKLARALEDSNRSLKSLNISRNAITSQAASALFNSVGKNSKMRTLAVGANCVNIVASPVALIAHKEMRSRLGQNLKSSFLTSLDISFCNLGDSLGSVLSGLLKTDEHTLSRIDASSNTMHSVSATKIAASLASNTWLSELVLDGNYFGLEGVLEILDGLGQNRSLTELSLKDCFTEIGDAQKEDVRPGSAKRGGKGKGEKKTAPTPPPPKKGTKGKKGKVPPEPTPDPGIREKSTDYSKIWLRNWGGVTREVVEAAQRKKEEWEKEEEEREAAEEERVAKELEAAGIKTKKSKKKGKAGKAKGGKKGKAAAPTFIEKRFFLAAVEEGESMETGNNGKPPKAPPKRPASADPRKPAKGKGPKKPPPRPASARPPPGPAARPEVAVEPVSWQRKAAVGERAGVVSTAGDIGAMFWLRVRQALNRRQVPCRVVGWENDRTVG